jgi:glycyl-tRNA synthetase
MAEIEHFVNPNDKQHPRFGDVADVELNLFSRDLQGGAEENTVRMDYRIIRGMKNSKMVSSW